MPSYDDWNDALADWFTVGQAHDTRIFMSIDDALIESVGRTLGVEADAVSAFVRAVRGRVVDDDMIVVERVRRAPRGGRPRFVAFLAVCVLAASRMQNQEERDIRETNFFSQLRQVLGLPDVKGRPEGLTPQDDESLWNGWGTFLSAQGLHSTARPGTGSREYVDYPISQTLLRKADKDRLLALYGTLNLGHNLDPASLLNRLNSVSLHARIAEALEDERREALIDAMHDLYEMWRQSGDHGGGSESGKLYAGLYRTVDFLGNATWLVYPREPRRQHRTLTEATRDGEHFPLSKHRPGFLCPITEVSARDLDEGTRFDIAEGGSIVLPARDYWILVSDPQDREENVFASWGAPALGSPFVVLVRQDKLSTFQRLEVDGLIRVGSKSQAFGDDRWWVLEDCVVVSESATRDFGRFHGITELRPSSRLTISVSGGIRAPGRGEWMEEHGPDIAVVAFEVQADVTVVRIDDGEVLHRGQMPTGERLPVEIDEKGAYRIEARVNDAVAVREIVVVGWEDIASTALLAPPVRRLDSATVCGARVEQLSEGARA